MVVEAILNVSPRIKIISRFRGGEIGSIFKKEPGKFDNFAGNFSHLVPESLAIHADVVPME